MQAPECERRQQRDSRAAGDQRLAGGDLVDFERHLGLEARRPAGAKDDLVAQVALGGVDPDVVRELAQLDRPRPREPVLARDHRRVGIIEQVGQLQLITQGTRRGLQVVHERQVEFAILEPRGCFRGLHLHHVQLDLRVAPVKGLDRRGHQRRAG